MSLVKLMGATCVHKLCNVVSVALFCIMLLCHVTIHQVMIVAYNVASSYDNVVMSCFDTSCNDVSGYVSCLFCYVMIASYYDASL